MLFRRNQYTPVAAVAAGGGGGAKVLTYQTHAEDTGDLTTYSFTSQAIGTAAADRRVHVGISGTQGTRTVSSVTIGGVAATQNVQFQAGVSTAAIYTANVPSGTTATIDVVWSGSQSRCGIGVWSSTGLSADTANATDSAVNDTGGTGTDLNVDVATLTGGFIIVYGVHHNNTSGGAMTYLPAAITHKFRNVVEATITHYGASGTTDGTTFDVRTSGFDTTNGNSAVVAASF